MGIDLQSLNILQKPKRKIWYEKGNPYSNATKKVFELFILILNIPKFRPNPILKRFPTGGKRNVMK